MVFVNASERIIIKVYENACCMLHVDNYILFFKVNDFEINDFEITLQLTGLRWQILWICLILQSEFSRGGGQNKRRSYIFVFSDSNDLNCQNKTFMCTVKEHRHVSQQNRITSKTNKIPLNLCSNNSINSIFKLMSTFFTRIIGLLQCIF